MRILVAIMLLLSLLLVPAGCGQTAEKDDDELFMEKYETPENLKQVPVKFVFPGTEPKNWNLVKKEIESRSADEVNAILDFKWVEMQQYIQEMSTLDASGEVIDAFCLGKPDSYLPDFVKLAREGKLKDITTLFPENAPSLFSKFSQAELDYAKADGKIYAVPSMEPTAYCTYLMVDDALHKKYNIPEITTLDHYEQYLKAIKENEPDLIPGTIANVVNTMNLFARAFDYVIVDDVQKLVYKWNDPDMKLMAWEQTPEFLQAVSKISSWQEKGYVKFHEADQTKITSFIYYGALYPPSEETTTMTFSTSGGDFTESNPLRVFYLYPEKKVQRDNSMGSFFFNGSFVFPSVSANTERALRYLDWVHRSKENYYLVMYGIEGTDYVLNSGFPTFPEGMDYNSRSYMYWDGYWAFNSLEYAPEMPDAYGSGLNSQKEFLDKYSMYAPHGAFYPNYKTIQEAADKRKAAFMKFEMQLSMGEINDVSLVSDFIGNMKELGSDNLVAEVQKQMKGK